MTRLALIVFALLSPFGSVCAVGSQPEIIQLSEAVVLKRQGRGGRNPIQTNDVLYAWAVDGFDPPDAGDGFERGDGSVDPWEAVAGGDDGWVRSPSLRGGYANFTVELDEAGVYLLDARSHSMAYVNGSPRGGNPYGFGYTRLPVSLNGGRNDFTFYCGRGQVWARLIEVEDEFDLLDQDRTLPDLIVDQAVDSWMGIIVLNASVAARDDLVVRATLAGGDVVETPVGWLEGVSTRKVAVRLLGVAPRETGEGEVKLTLIDASGTVLGEDSFTLHTRNATDKHVRTFVSEIDGSCQYFAVTPRRGDELGEGESPALILTLHGAGVEGRGQANAYGHKDWADIVAPTNRRAYGFDWEDWGRKDAIEVLNIASEVLGSDPRRTYLSGHSMGGHGAWHVGVSFPGRFAAIGPSAGWVSFWSYTGAARYEDASPIEALLRRAASPSDTIELERTLEGLGVYVLHGDKDDNVPVAQARTMRERLGSFHPDFSYYERPGAGHWWGNQCVDWTPMMDFFEGRSRSAAPTGVRFATMSPAVSATSDWVTIVAQERAMERSSVDLTLDGENSTIRGTTKNVQRLALDLSELDFDQSAVSVELDGQTIEFNPESSGTTLLAARLDGQWSRASLDLTQKRAERMGPFKEVFDRRAVLVYGTGGSAEENLQVRAKALFDGETFAYRGNGSFVVIPDTEYDQERYAGRNVVLYGNARTNKAMGALLWGAPVVIDSGRVVIGGREFKGDDLGLLMVRPHPDGEGLVGLVGNSGLVGARAIEALPVFVSGVAYPDVTLMRAGMLIEGTEGVECAGFFGNDWSVESGEFGFRD